MSMANIIMSTRQDDPLRVEVISHPTGQQPGHAVWIRPGEGAAQVWVTLVLDRQDRKKLRDALDRIDCLEGAAAKPPIAA